MDDRSAARYAAYKHGRGAEYDDKTHAREEARKSRAEPTSTPAANAHEHAHPHSALAAARKAKAAEAKASKAD